MQEYYMVYGPGPPEKDKTRNRELTEKYYKIRCDLIRYLVGEENVRVEMLEKYDELNEQRKREKLRELGLENLVTDNILNSRIELMKFLARHSKKTFLILYGSGATDEHGRLTEHIDTSEKLVILVPKEFKTIEMDNWIGITSNELRNRGVIISSIRDSEEAINIAITFISKSRNIKNQPALEKEKIDDFFNWCSEAYNRWISLASKKRPENPKFNFYGIWYLGYVILDQYIAPNRKELLKILKDVEDHKNGYPVWNTRLDEPKPYLGFIESLSNFSFWRASLNGMLFQLRGYRFDRPNFEVTQPIWILTECLLHAKRFRDKASPKSKKIGILADWEDLHDRELTSFNSDYSFFRSFKSTETSAFKFLEVMIDNIPEKLEEIISELATPLYESFDFFEPPSDMIEKVILKIKNSSSLEFD